MKRRLVVTGITMLITLSFIASAAAFIGQHRDQLPSANEAGHVLVVTSGSATVFDSSGEVQVRSTCTEDSRQLQTGWDVVALSDTPVTIHGYPFYLVAYPDPCQPAYDFSHNDQISQSRDGDGPAAVGYVAADLLSEAVAVYPYSNNSSVVWRDCWEPNRCNDRQLKGSNIQFNSPDSQTLSAWWTGSIWDPHWWHIKGFSQEDAAVEGRYWVAVSTLKPAPPAQQFAYELKSILPEPVQVYTANIYQEGYVDFTLQFINTGDRPLNLQDTWIGENGLPAYCLYPDKDTALQVDNVVGCVSPDTNQTTSPPDVLSFHVHGHFPQSYGKDIGHFYVEYRGYPMLLDPDSPQGAVSFVWPTPQPVLTLTTDVTQQPSPQPTVTQPVQQDNAALLSQSQSATGDPGQQVSISFTLQNTGNTTWSDNGYHLVCTMTCPGVQTTGFNGQSIQPGQQYVFTVTLTLPTTPGTYTTQWILQHNGQDFGPQLSMSITVVAMHWSPILQESSPTCSNSGAAVWTIPNPGMTGRNCTNSVLEMQQLHNYYAEDDLTTVNGTSYSQTNFRVQVTFPNPGDTNTWAALVVQTPQGSCGGLIFALNASGQWQLQNVQSCTSLPVVESGTISIDPGQATTMTIKVQNDVLLASINVQQVLSYNDTLSPSQALVGLMVMSSHIPSALIQYENFELDMWK